MRWLAYHNMLLARGGAGAGNAGHHQHQQPKPLPSFKTTAKGIRSFLRDYSHEVWMPCHQPEHIRAQGETGYGGLSHKKAYVHLCVVLHGRECMGFPSLPSMLQTPHGLSQLKRRSWGLERGLSS